MDEEPSTQPPDESPADTVARLQARVERLRSLSEEKRRRGQGPYRYRDAPRPPEDPPPEMRLPYKE